jgi:hypothetical protein
VDEQRHRVDRKALRPAVHFDTVNMERLQVLTTPDKEGWLRAYTQEGIAIWVNVENVTYIWDN